MKINGLFHYELSGYNVAIEVTADENGVFVRDVESLTRNGQGVDDISDEELEKLTAEIDAVLEEEHEAGEWAAILEDAQDDVRIINDTGALDPQFWAPKEHSMPRGYRVH